MPLILGTNSIKDTGYDVANSCRFNSGSSDHLTRSLGASETSTRIATWSFWVKRGNLGSYNIYSNEVEDDNNRGYFQFNADQLRMVDEAGTGTELKATQVFRDVSAWYHIVIAMDTTQSTSTNRVKWYVNGNQISIDATTTFPPQNTDQKILIGGQTNKNHIGKIHPSGGEFDGYFAEFVFIDGQQLAPDQFGEFDDDSGIWKPIDVSGLTFGNNGFYLDFESSGSLGNDVSGNDNDFTANNLTAIDSVSDVPTNNFATLNPLDNYYASSTFSEGNLKIVTNGSAIIYNTSTIGFSSGKWYMEVKVSSNVRYVVGVVRGVATANDNGNKLGNRSDGWGYDYRGLVENNGSDLGGSFASYTSGDIIGIYADLDNNELYFSKNGTLQNSGTGLTLTAGTYFFALGNNHTSESSTLEANFGSPPFSISSGNTDANGYGNFEYDPSSGTFDSASKDFLSLNTKNLAEYG